MSNLEAFYNKNYKKLLLIPAILLVVSILILGSFYSKHGDIMLKDVSLEGGVSATAYVDRPIDIEQLRNALNDDLGKDDIFVRSLESVDEESFGFLVEADDIAADELETAIENNLNIDLDEENFFVQETGSRLGQGFYRQMINALWISFLLMGFIIFFVYGEKITVKIITGLITAIAVALVASSGTKDAWVVLSLVLSLLLLVLYTINSIPSVAVILSTILDLIATIAVIDLIGIRISAAGISALLLIIGYSVDTDVVLTTKLIKRKDARSNWEKIVDSAKTGLTMTFTTLTAMIIGYLFAFSLVLKEMFLIIFIGLLVDLIATYLMNASILKWYIERKHHG